MKIQTVLLLLCLCVAPVVSGTQTRLTSVTQPLYLHGSDGDARISLTPVPCVTDSSEPEWRFTAISAPFTPPVEGSNASSDVNLASLYKVKVSSTYKSDGTTLVVTVDASKAVQPEDYPFSVEQVIDAVVTCVKIMYPARPKEEGEFEIVVLRKETEPRKAKEKD